MTNQTPAELLARIAELEESNQNCISLFLHETRMKEAEARIAELEKRLGLSEFANKANQALVDSCENELDEKKARIDELEKRSKLAIEIVRKGKDIGMMTLEEMYVFQKDCDDLIASLKTAQEEV